MTVNSVTDGEDTTVFCKWFKGTGDLEHQAFSPHAIQKVEMAPPQPPQPPEPTEEVEQPPTTSWERLEET